MVNAQALHEAIERIERGLRRREDANAATPGKAELSRHTLDLSCKIN
jgi:hypothetical protein